VPKRADDPKHLLPLQDAQRALGYLRFHAKELNIDPSRIGVMGFSAGGHLAANLSNNFEKRAYEAVDDADKVSCRPDLAILIYPAYLAAGDKLSSDIKVTSATPPTFLVQSEDDHIGVENCLFYYLALKNNKVAAAMHLFPTGGHGYGLGVNGGLVATWPQICARWLQDMKVAK
jgi:acetyl esterase/lipase